MKRTIIAILLCVTGMVLFAQSEEVAIWSALFDTADTVEEQLVYIKNVSDSKLSGAEEFYAKALRRLLEEYPNLRTRSELDAADTAARTLVSRLGEAKYADAAGDIWRTVDRFSNPLVKADALVALGQTGNKTYLPQVIQVLTDLNSRPQSDVTMRESYERIAYGAIIALESYQDPAGYLPVFLAYTGWYAERIKNQASIALPNITADPTEPLLEILRSPAYTTELKELALITSERSQSSEENKSRVAVAALTEAWNIPTNDVRQRQVLSQIRKTALSMIRRYGTSDTAVYSQIDKSYNNGDMDEKLATLQTLAALPTEDSVRLVSGYLRAVHQRRLSGTLTTNDEQLVRAIIPVLGNIGSASPSQSRPILLLVQGASEWTNAVKNLAAAAVRQVGY
jgi:HEAT repeat protein